MGEPIKVRMRPGLTRLGGKLYIMAGCLIPVPDNTTMQDLHKYVIFDPAFRENNEVTDSWTVEGSKGNKYTVRKMGDRFICSCPGFAFRKTCKHSKKISEEVN
jgi:hypothetical protein